MQLLKQEKVKLFQNIFVQVYHLRDTTKKVNFLIKNKTRSKMSTDCTQYINTPLYQQLIQYFDPCLCSDCGFACSVQGSNQCFFLNSKNAGPSVITGPNGETPTSFSIPQTAFATTQLQSYEESSQYRPFVEESNTKRLRLFGSATDDQFCLPPPFDMAGYTNFTALLDETPNCSSTSTPCNCESTQVGCLKCCSSTTPQKWACLPTTDGKSLAFYHCQEYDCPQGYEVHDCKCYRSQPTPPKKGSCACEYNSACWQNDTGIDCGPTWQACCYETSGLHRRARCFLPSQNILPNTFYCNSQTKEWTFCPGPEPCYVAQEYNEFGFGLNDDCTPKNDDNMKQNLCPSLT
jgi:hypothetical protein